MRVLGRHTDGSTALGSGVVIGARYVVTAKHVLRGCTAAVCEFNNGQRISVAQALDSNYADQTVLELTAETTAQPAPIAAADPRAGETLTLAGFDNGRRLRFYDASSGLVGRYDYGKVTDANAPAISGNSGGPVFNSRGEFVGTLWGSDGRTTSLVNNATTHRFLREVAQRFPAFGSCYRQACAPVRQPKPQQPITNLEPVQPANPCDCSKELSRLKVILEQLVADQQKPALTDQQLKQAIERYLESDPLTVTMIIRDRDGNIPEGGVDVARVVPVSKLTEEQRQAMRDSLQLVPVR